ncbi:MAG: type II toxin-antitoxin system HicA family toxin [Desulfovibrio sp.]
MNTKQRKTLSAISHDPLSGKIKWTDIESLLLSLGAEITEGKGSRVRIKLNGLRAVFHRPHPEKVTDKGAIKSVRVFLQRAGVSV